MIVSLVFKDRHNVNTDSYGNFLYSGKKLNVKNIPFVRYRFENFVESDIEYIKKMMGIFKHSTHLAEVIVKDGYEEQLYMLNSNFEKLAVFLYLPVYDSHVKSFVLTEHEKELLGKLVGASYIYDRIMLKDCSNSLYLVSANKLRREIYQITGFNEQEIGICSSPLSFGPDACLTAIRARALSSIYGQSEECALPSANHESMNCCGCIKYIVVENDLEAPVTNESKKGSIKVKKEKPVEDSNNEEKKEDKNTKKKRSGKVISAW